MRHFLNAALLTLVLGFGCAGAADFTVAQTQQLISLAEQKATKGGPAVEITMQIGGVDVVLLVSRDQVGNLTARPKADPAYANLGISQISIQMKTNAGGTQEPKSMLVIGSDLAITSYALAVNKDGTISQSQSGTFVRGGSGGGDGKPTGGIFRLTGSDSGTNTHKTLDSWLGATFPSFTSAQLDLPAGAGTAEVSASVP